MGEPQEVFIAACVGAIVPILFFRSTVPGTEDRSPLTKGLLTAAYVAVAGYVAVCVLRLDSTCYAFLLGVALDTFLGLVRPIAARCMKRLAHLLD